jgi:hypothetical protein
MTGHRRRPPRAALISVLVAVLVPATVIGCAEQPPSPTPASASASSASAPGAAGQSTPAPPTVVDGLGLSVLQNRPDYGKRVLQLSVTNEADEPVTIVAARFESAQFATPALWSKPTDVPAGLIRQLPVQLGEAVCPTPAAHPSLVVTLVDASGSTRDVVATPSDPFGVLERIAREDCLDDAVATIATLRLDDSLRVSGDGSDAVAHVRLLVEPVPAATDTPSGAAPEGDTPERDTSEGDSAGRALQLDSVGSTILLAPAKGDAWPLDATFSAGDATADFALDTVPARCDPHAIAEDKRGTFLPVAVSIEGGLAGTVFVPSSDALRLAIYDFIASRCGFTSD